jgi:hypothetical protein
VGRADVSRRGPGRRHRSARWRLRDRPATHRNGRVLGATAATPVPGRAPWHHRGRARVLVEHAETTQRHGPGVTDVGDGRVTDLDTVACDVTATATAAFAGCAGCGGPRPAGRIGPAARGLFDGPARFGARAGLRWHGRVVHVPVLPDCHLLLTPHPVNLRPEPHLAVACRGQDGAGSRGIRIVRAAARTGYRAVRIIIMLTARSRR